MWWTGKISCTKPDPIHGCCKIYAREYILQKTQRQTVESHHLYYDKQKNILVWKMQSRYKLTYCVKVLWSGSLCYISNILYFTVRYVFFIYSLITRAVPCDGDCYDAKYNISLQWIFAGKRQWHSMVLWDDDDDLPEGQIKEVSIFFLALLYNKVKITCELNLR